MLQTCLARSHGVLAIKRRSVLAAVAVVAAILASIVAPAAASASWVHNQRAPTVSLMCVHACGGIGTFINVNNGTSVRMFCYYDGNWATGNYSSNRWFKVYPAGRYGLWQVHSSYVYYQTQVPRC